MGVAKKVVGGVRRAGKFYLWTLFGSWRDVRENAGRLRNRLDEIRNREYRSETFEEAVERLRLTEEDLMQRHNLLHGLSILYGLVAVLAMGFLASAPFSSHPINHALMSIGVLVLSSTKLLAARFRVDQIRHRELFGFKSWVFGRAGR